MQPQKPVGHQSPSSSQVVNRSLCADHRRTSVQQSWFFHVASPPVEVSEEVEPRRVQAFVPEVPYLVYVPNMLSVLALEYHLPARVEKQIRNGKSCVDVCKAIFHIYPPPVTVEPKRTRRKAPTCCRACEPAPTTPPRSFLTLREHKRHPEDQLANLRTRRRRLR